MSTLLQAIRRGKSPEVSEVFRWASTGPSKENSLPIAAFLWGGLRHDMSLGKRLRDCGMDKTGLAIVSISNMRWSIAENVLRTSYFVLGRTCQGTEVLTLYSREG